MEWCPPRFNSFSASSLSSVSPFSQLISNSALGVAADCTRRWGEEGEGETESNTWRCTRSQNHRGSCLPSQHCGTLLKSLLTFDKNAKSLILHLMLLLKTNIIRKIMTFQTFINWFKNPVSTLFLFHTLLQDDYIREMSVGLNNNVSDSEAEMPEGDAVAAKGPARERKTRAQRNKEKIEKLKVGLSFLFSIRRSNNIMKSSLRYHKRYFRHHPNFWHE